MTEYFFFLGLLIIEKVQLLSELGQYWTEQAQKSVCIVDNMAGMQFDTEVVFQETLVRIDGELAQQMELLQQLQQDIILVAVSEQANPESVWSAIEQLKLTRAEVNIHTIALLDLRTCDCFPHVREMLEAVADVALYAPFNVADVLDILFRPRNLLKIMTKREKRLQKIRNNPKNVSFDELRVILEDVGFTIARVSGSHYIFIYQNTTLEIRLVIPYRNPVKSRYVRQALDKIDQIQSIQE